jgi:hypothetical protein
MSFRNVSDIADAVQAGRVHTQNYFKSTYPFPGASQWVDGAVCSGTPIYQAYVGSPNVSYALFNNGNAGIYTGPELPAAKAKYLLSYNFSASGAGTPASAFLLDYLIFYPFIDCDSTEEQQMDNASALPRYEDGTGVVCFIVTQVPNNSGAAASMTIQYLDTAENGETVVVQVLGNTVIGTLMNTTEVGRNAGLSARSPFCQLNNGTLGIRSIKNVRLSAGIGGFATLVLARPIHLFPIWEQQTFTEKTFVKETGTLPRIENGAHLNLLFNAGSGAGLQPMAGQFTFIWS